MMAATYSKARAGRTRIRSKFERLLGEHVAVGVTPNPRGDGWAVSVNLTNEPKTGQKIPSSVYGIPVVVEVVGTMEGLSARPKARCKAKKAN